MSRKPPPKPAAKPAISPARKPSAATAPVDAIVARSARELAELVGRSHTAVNRWLKDGRWTFGGGPWKASAVAAIRDWIRRELAEPAGGEEGESSADSAKLSIKTKADVQLKLTRNKLLVHQFEVLTGKVHPVDQCQRDRLRAIQEVRQGLLNLPDSLPVDADTKTIVKGRVVELLRRFAAGLGSPDAAAKPSAVPAVG